MFVSLVLISVDLQVEFLLCFFFFPSFFFPFPFRFWRGIGDILLSAKDLSILHLFLDGFFRFGMAGEPGTVFVAFLCMMMAGVFFCGTCYSTTFSFGTGLDLCAGGAVEKKQSCYTSLLLSGGA